MTEDKKEKLKEYLSLKKNEITSEHIIGFANDCCPVWALKILAERSIFRRIQDNYDFKDIINYVKDIGKIRNIKKKEISNG
ncbi:MAG: hypothetical protein JXB50_16890 [Spirochaetes bacterium]|nr:hypothetical protein [Spirochaetota bacterium]